MDVAQQVVWLGQGAIECDRLPERGDRLLERTAVSVEPTQTHVGLRRARVEL